MSLRVHVRGREIPKERLFFLVALSISLLLLSVVMLRSSEDAVPAFRDGFIVANRATSLPMERRVTEEPTPASERGMKTTTIHTEDGDEITIKRNAESRRITTISAHENGKITIEHEEQPEDADDNRVEDGGEEDPVTEEAAALDREEEAVTSGFSTSYEKLSADRTNPGRGEEEEEEGNGKQKRDQMTVMEEDEEGETEELETEEAPQRLTVVDDGEKVTVVQVGRARTQVRVGDAEERGGEQYDQQERGLDEEQSVEEGEAQNSPPLL